MCYNYNKITRKGVKSLKKAVGMLMLLISMCFTGLVLAENLENHWAATEIESIQEQGIMIGTGDGFEPDRTITRAEFVCAVVRAIKAEPSVGASSFGDVAEGKYYTPYINKAAELGLVSGFGDGTFRPESLITREEAVIVLSRAYGYLSGYSFGKGFSDYADISESAKAAISYALKEKVIVGYDDNTLRPKGNLTRAEAACLILRSQKIEKTALGFVIGYPKIDEKGAYAKIRIEVRTNMPCTVYYVLNDSEMTGIPAGVAVNNFLTQTSANTTVECEIDGEIGQMYNLSLMAVAPDGRRSNIVQIEKVMPCPYTDGDGTKENPYAISNAKQLDYVRYFSDKAFVLQNNIKLSGEWEPISEFYGYFDGNGYKIEGLYVNTDERYAGLFGKIVKGEIKNLSVDGNVTARANAGIFAGELLDAKVTSCVASGRVTALTNNAGGFFGESAGRIENSLSSVYIVEANSFAGGLVGQNYGIIKDSLSAAHTVTANIYAGGIASVNLSGGRIENSVAANIYVYDMMLNNCGRVAANRDGSTAKGNYAYSDMRTNSEDAVNEHDNNNGADIAWEELINRDRLCKKLGWNTELWAGGSKAEQYLIPYPSAAKQPQLAAGVCEYSPVRISRAAELYAMVNNPDMHYLLTCDITFESYHEWTPIGDTLSQDEGFSGTFDGDGHTIYGLTVARSENGLCGLFGMISGGEVRNLKLADVNLVGGNIIASIAAVNNGNIKNCTIEGLGAKAVEADAYIGGVCGYNYATVQNCIVTGDIMSDTRNVVIGGIVAHNEGFVDNVSFQGSITTTRNSGISESVAGGVCGYNAGGMIYNAYAKPRMNQKAAVVYAGGVCAIQNGGELYKCSSSGGINCNSYDSTAVSYAGSICGLASGGIMMHAYSTCDITQYTPRCYAGGLCGFNEGAVIQNGYSQSNLYQNTPSIAEKKISYAGGICGYNEGGIIASTVAVNKTISSDGVTGRICAAGTEDSIYGNFATKMSTSSNGEGAFGGEEVLEKDLDYEFFTKPIAEGGRLGWSQDIWVDSGSLPLF